MNKRLWLRFFVGAALGLSLLGQPVAAVPVLNAGFTSGVGAAHHWKIDQSPLGHGTGKVSATAGKFHAGAPGVVFKGRNPTKASHVASISQTNIPFIKNDSYKLSGFFARTGTNTNHIFLGAITGKSVSQNINSTKLTNNFQAFSFTFKSNFTGNGAIFFGAYNKAGSAKVFLDDVSLIDLTASGPVVPEIDPTQGTTAAALLATAGCLAIDKRKRRKG